MEYDLLSGCLALFFSSEGATGGGGGGGVEVVTSTKIGSSICNTERNAASIIFIYADWAFCLQMDRILSRPSVENKELQLVYESVFISFGIGMNCYAWEMRHDKNVCVLGVNI